MFLGFCSKSLNNSSKLNIRFSFKTLFSRFSFDTNYYSKNLKINLYF